MTKEWVATCKDCKKEFRYSDHSYRRDEERGYSRPERCPACRILRKLEIDTSGAGYFQIKIVGDEPLSAGILGDVYHGERPHILEDKPSQLANFEFGIKEENIREVYRAFDEEGFRIAVIEGPTGSGKSTYLPYRLIEAPPGVRTPDIFTRDGQVVVTQPRILPTSGISKFISGSLIGSSVGQGVDIGYKHSGSTETDRRNRLVFVTDGTLINWIKNDQLSHISVIMIDEAHERSKNIDLILMLLRDKLARYPKLKLIIASATINAKDFITYYGGESKVRHLEFKGMMFEVKENFATKEVVDYVNFLKKPSQQIDEEISSLVTSKVIEVVDLASKGGHTQKGDLLAFLHSEKSVDLAVSKVQRALQEKGLRNIDVLPLYRNLSSTRQNKVLEKKATILTNKIINEWFSSRPKEVKDLIGVLLDEKSVLQTVENLSDAINKVLQADENQSDAIRKKKEILDNVLIIPIISRETPELPEGHVKTEGRKAIITNYENLSTATSLYPSAKIIDDWRIVIATNVAETSLTVDGTVHVIDSGLIKQNVFDPETRTQRLMSTTHSQAGCRQRKGRAGRIRPGFVHYLYTHEQFNSFIEYTPPEVERSSLEDLVLQAKAAGVGDLNNFAWFKPTEGMLKEVNSAQESLKTRGAIDSDGEITEIGLEMLNMTLDPLVASVLMKADQLCCALEAATLLGFVTLNTPITNSLFIWNNNWDSQTRWEIKNRQKCLLRDCKDDFEMVLRTISAWENSSMTPAGRSSWAKQMYVNHDFIQNRLFPQREELLAILSAGLRGKAFRPVDLSLLERVRFAAALATGDQISERGKEIIGRDSHCWINTPEQFVYLKKTPYKITNSESRYYQVSLIGLVKDEWITGNFGKVPFTNYIPVLHSLSSRDTTGRIFTSCAVNRVYAGLFPPGTEFKGSVTAENTPLLQGQPSSPAPLIQEVAGWGRELELITDHRIEEEIGQDETADIESYTKPAEDDILTEDEEVVGFTPPIEESKVTLHFQSLPAMTEYLKITSREGLSFESVHEIKERIFQISLPTGSHNLTITPILKETGKIEYQANLYLYIEEGKNYLVVMGQWLGKYPSGNSVLDSQAKSKQGKASLRWAPVGWKDRPIIVMISEQTRTKSAYYYYNANSEYTLEVYPKDGSRNQYTRLGQYKLELSEGHAYTLVIYNSFSKGNPPNFELIEDETGGEDSEGIKIPIPMQFSLNEDIGRKHSMENEVFVIEDCDALEDILNIQLSIKGDDDPFNKFCEMYKPGNLIMVQPIDVDLYQNGNENALIVREPKSGLYIAVRAIDLFFDSKYSGLVLSRFLERDSLEMEVEWIDIHQKRIGLTRLDLLSDVVTKHFKDREKRTLKTKVLAIEHLVYPFGLVVCLEIDDNYFIPGLIWKEQLEANSKRLDEFKPGDEVDLIVKFTVGKVKAAKISDETVDAICSKVNEIKVSPKGIIKQLQINRPITPAEYSELFAIDDNADFRWIIRELYRRSNQPRIDLYDRKHIESIEADYPIGSIIQGRVSEVFDEKVIVELKEGITGIITRGEWTNRQVSSFNSETKVGEIITAKVISIKENGQLSLSRLRAAISQFKVNMVCQCKIIDVLDQFLIVSLNRDIVSKNEFASLTARIHITQAIYKFLPNYRTLSLRSQFKIGQQINAKITLISISEHINIDATFTHAYQALMKIPQEWSDQIRFLIGTGGKRINEIRNKSTCGIITESQADGSINLKLASQSEDNIYMCSKEIFSIIPKAVWIGKT